MQFLMFVIQFVASMSAYADLAKCHTYGPRLDGAYVTVCGGSVRSVRREAP